MRSVHRLVPPLALTLSPMPSAAADTPDADPAVYLQAFNDTCRRGFTDIDAIARDAVAQGWIESSIRPIGGPPDLLATLPRAFRKAGLMLFLNRRDAGPFSSVCQVTGSAPTRLAGKDVAAVVTPSLHAGAAVLGPGNYKEDDYASWTIAPGRTVQAGVSVHNRKVRTISIALRQARLATAAAAPPAAPAKPDDNIPMVAIGMSFSPENPTPVDATHPLYHGIEIGEIEGLPATVKSSSLNFIAAAKRSSVNAALRESFRQMNLLAPDAAVARKRLTVNWKGDRTPFHIGTSNATSVTMHYRLARVDDGRTLFDRDITTAAQGGGANASMRDNGIVRAAIAANFASAANCLDRAAYGTDPADCALAPNFSVSVVRLER